MCKDLKRNGPSAAIALDAAYTPVSNRVGSRSFKRRSRTQETFV
ncbi:hypothetical protein LCACRF28_1025 [Lacticaseibacillus paracasei]|nr:hypothetical protein LCACRF28_1025 [Lacticaseibacillus paracasei]